MKLAALAAQTCMSLSARPTGRHFDLFKTALAFGTRVEAQWPKILAPDAAKQGLGCRNVCQLEAIAVNPSKGEGTNIFKSMLFVQQTQVFYGQVRAMGMLD